MTVKTDPTRCWVRIDQHDPPGQYSYDRLLIGDAWALEPWGTGKEEDEFSLTLTRSSGEGYVATVGMRLDPEEGTALRNALDQWLTHMKGTQ